MLKQFHFIAEKTYLLTFIITIHKLTFSEQKKLPERVNKGGDYIAYVKY